MALTYVSSDAAAQCVHQSMSGPQLFVYTSTIDSSDCAVTGFFEGCGAASRGGTNNVGMRVGDIVFTVASTNASQPSEVVAHGVISTTADQTSTAGATGWNAAYDATISAT